MRKKVYIAGPISKGCLLSNVNQATAAFVALAKLGFAPLCPHWSVYSKPAERRDIYVERNGRPSFAGSEVFCVATAMGNDDMVHADWMGVDLPWVAVADAVLRLPGESTGADLETAHAARLGVPVFGTVEELVRFFDDGQERRAG